MRWINVVTIACLTAFATPALAQSQTQKNVLNKLADITVLEELCPKLEKNSFLVEMSLLMHKIDVNKKKFSKYLDEKITETRCAMVGSAKDIEGDPTPIYCMTAIYLYGESGVNVEGLMKERE